MKIKHLLLFAATLSALLSCSPKNEVHLQGKIIGYNGEYTSLFYMDQATGDYRDIKIEIAPDGQFDTVIPLDSSLFHTAIFVDKFMFSICLEKGKSYQAEFDITEDGVESNYRFIGEGEKEIAFVRDFNNDFDSYYYIQSLNTAEGFATFQKAMQADAERYYARLKEIGNRAFARYYSNEIEESSNFYTLCFPYFALKEKGAVEVDADYVAWDSDRFVRSQSEAEINKLFTHIYSFVQFNDVSILDFLTIADATTTDQVRKEIILTNLMLSFMNSGNTDNLKEGYARYAQLCPNEYYTNQVFEIYNSLVNLVRGEEAPDLEFQDMEGKIFHLSDFKGKPVYVDLWASWCSPCCAEIPHLAELVKAIGKKRDIVCISISTDNNREDWVAKVKADEAIEGHPVWGQYIATEKGNHAISKAYNVNAIPRFMFFDKEGKIVTIDAPRPSEKNILSTLRNLLK